jgi:ATP-binding cassette subfamily C protein
MKQRSVVGEILGSYKGAFLAAAVFSAVVNILMLTGSMYMLQVYDRVLTGRSIPTLIALTVLVLGLYALQGAIDYLRTILLARVGAEVDRRMSGPVFDNVLRTQIRRDREGDPTQPTRDIDVFRGFLTSGGPSALFDLPWLPVYLLVCFLLHPVLGWTVFIGAVVLMALTLWTEMRSKAPLEQYVTAAGRRHMWLENCRKNAETIQALGMRDMVRGRWTSRHDEMVVAQTRSSDATSGLGAASKTFRFAFQSIILGVGAYLVIQQQASPGVMIAASILAGRALAPIEMAIAQWKNFVAARQAYHRLSVILTEQVEPKTVLPKPHLGVQVRDLTIVPPGTRRVALQGVNFTVKAGDAVAVVGPSASGKSSLARALVGVWPAARGEVRVDGALLTHWKEEDLGRFVGYLPQEVDLFDGTLAENIARFDPEATSDGVIAAARLANAHEMVQRFEQGYDTPIGERGTVLSGGQRQRLGLARAVYGEPFLVVMDEPNANLDAEGEQALSATIKELRRRGMVVFVMAHRANVLAEVSHVLVLRDGRQEKFGTRDEVLQQQQRRPAGPMQTGGLATGSMALAPATALKIVSSEDTPPETAR